MSTTVTREKPILFSGPMVRAILSGRKTMTRRVVKPQPPSVEAVQKKCGTDYHWMPPGRGVDYWRVAGPVWAVRELMGREPYLRCPYGKPGDERLWVRETWAHTNDYDGQVLIGKRTALYRADEETTIQPSRWRPSIFMPRWASRITLEITGVRVERLQDISHEDACAEGFDKSTAAPDDKALNGRTWGRLAFSQLWDKLNADRGYSWDSSPWVWVVSFRRAERGSGK